MKILKNIEGKNKQQLNAIEDQGNKQLSPIKNISVNSKKLKLIDSFSKISPEAEKLMSETKEDKMLSTLKNLFLWEPIKNILILEFLKVHTSLLRIFPKGFIKRCKRFSKQNAH